MTRRLSSRHQEFRKCLGSVSLPDIGPEACGLKSKSIWPRTPLLSMLLPLLSFPKKNPRTGEDSGRINVTHPNCPTPSSPSQDIFQTFAAFLCSWSVETRTRRSGRFSSTTIHPAVTGQDIPADPALSMHGCCWSFTFTSSHTHSIVAVPPPLTVKLVKPITGISLLRRLQVRRRPDCIWHQCLVGLPHGMFYCPTSPAAECHRYPNI